MEKNIPEIVKASLEHLPSGSRRRVRHLQAAAEAEERQHDHTDHTDHGERRHGAAGS